MQIMPWQAANFAQVAKFHGFPVKKAHTQVQKREKWPFVLVSSATVYPTVTVTGHSTQFLFALFSLQTVSLLSPKKQLCQATHHPFLIAAPKTFTKIMEESLVSRFIFPQSWRVSHNPACKSVSFRRSPELNAQGYSIQGVPKPTNSARFHRTRHPSFTCSHTRQHHFCLSYFTRPQTWNFLFW